MRFQWIYGIAALAAGFVLCPAQSQAAESCYVLNGRLSAWNGTPNLRIEADHHLFGVVSSDTNPLPPAIDGKVDFDHSVTGQFTVCEVAQAPPDGMRFVWVEAVENAEVVASQTYPPSKSISK